MRTKSRRTGGTKCLFISNTLVESIPHDRTMQVRYLLSCRPLNGRHDPWFLLPLPVSDLKKVPIGLSAVQPRLLDTSGCFCITSAISIGSCTTNRHLTISPIISATITRILVPSVRLGRGWALAKAIVSTRGIASACFSASGHIGCCEVA